MARLGRRLGLGRRATAGTSGHMLCIVVVQVLPYLPQASAGREEGVLPQASAGRGILPHAGALLRLPAACYLWLQENGNPFLIINHTHYTAGCRSRSIDGVWDRVGGWGLGLGHLGYWGRGMGSRAPCPGSTGGGMPRLPSALGLSGACGVEA
eukprot:scaffold27168_cov128-Isochrysis_galbana.AAC.1